MRQNLLQKAVCLGMVGLAVLTSAARAENTQEERRTVKQSFKQAWQVEVPSDTMRIGSGDVSGDKKFQLFTLGKDGVLTIYDVSGDNPKETSRVELGSEVTSFVVGSFVKDKPAIVAVEGAYFVRGNDGTYTKTVKNTLRPINGMLRPYEKAESLYSKGLANRPKEFVFATKNEKTEVNDKEMSQTKGYYNIVSIRIPKEDAAQYPISPGMPLGGFHIFADKVKESAYLLTVLVENDKQFLCVYDFKQMSSSNTSESIKPIWIGAEIPGKILDVVVGSNLKDSKMIGALVLTESNETPKKRMVTFFGKEEPAK